MFPYALDDQYLLMPWDALDAVVFDVGNVLLKFDRTIILDRCFPGDALRQSVLSEKIFRSPYWAALDHGLISAEEAAVAMAGHDRQLLPDIRHVLDVWPGIMDPMPEGIDALKACKAHGKKVYILSNFHLDPFASVRSRCDFFDLADGFVISAQVRLCKPDPMIYRHLISAFQLIPSRTLFIDDTPANVEAAMHEGWQGICYNRPGKLAAFIA